MDYKSFLTIHFWDLKLVPMDLALNSASRFLTYYFKYVDVIPRKAVKLENLG